MSRLKPIAGELGSLWLDMKYNHEIKKDGTIVLERSDYDWKTQEEAQQFLDNWMPPEEWLTKEEVKSEADKGLKEALMCSIIHWRQIVLDVENGKAIWSLCALCQKYNSYALGDCYDCPLNEVERLHCGRGSAYRNYIDDKTLENAIIMHNLLINKYNELFGENNMKDEMLKIDGIDVSVSTIKNALKQAGIKLEKEYIPKVGDIFKTYLGKRVLIERHGKYMSISLFGKSQCEWKNTILGVMKDCNYDACLIEKVGELKDLL